MRNINEDTITQAVLASMDDRCDSRLRTIITSLVQHLHSFVRDIKLTEAEWLKAIQFLTEAGHITDDKRQEFILLSDTLGLSMLVMALNHKKPTHCTEATVFGPFYVEGAPEYENGADIANGARGEPCFVSGQIRGLDGTPVSGARIDVWQSDEDGFYDVQRSSDGSGSAAHQARGRLYSGIDGKFQFRSILAEAYPIPHDGPVGRMLEALGRHPWRPAHLHFMIVAPGYETLITHVFRDGDKYLDSDAVFGVRSTLITDWVEHDPGVAPDGTKMKKPFYTVNYDFVLNPAEVHA
ncbi:MULTISPECIES: intradiol ring-cleavage dioxygenase [Paraburkholderia]|jgi:hydroxyquinol 1,2-dioxygenase|uniref:Hydroxyquinol 1,2-dioxygenase n=1 Tax=Paraburkholderia aspalathi TaxID=1324617 RepID=A0ABM8S5H0_9BURK|nr:MULTISPECIES: intradiol ring-cleavage dioxygenase [Paraburkholderia]MCP2090108.1 hydroxyquinol 1,2-dioxygenase [Paraburkholderia sediminicola]MBK3820926.1 intradiol ring-cleavage dioxygenase [Paraburkholderia aspalathi]MBK3832715.1 intradiol ring-cleavage dioxygenase [Paraburkholderia aspalathi]MBK3862483.1 intradiol ring-cleavage dioxygenase [Paraburkholderia aspalathi]MCX4158283.1 intradiol ring-cleavage dioxygenase [Paraburkholderia aspalathi]